MLGSAVATVFVAAPKLLYNTPLVAVDLLWVCNAVLSELQNHLRTFPHGLFIALTAGQEVWVLVVEVRVVEDQRLYSDRNEPKEHIIAPSTRSGKKILQTMKYLEIQKKVKSHSLMSC